jgi:hypothetical protein
MGVIDLAYRQPTVFEPWRGRDRSTAVRAAAASSLGNGWYPNGLSAEN